MLHYVWWLDIECRVSEPVYESSMSLCCTGEAQVLIATDVASRGLDIKDITLVRNTLHVVLMRLTGLYVDTRGNKLGSLF